MYQGPIRFVVAAECMKQFPCWCHREPSLWLIATAGWIEGKGIAYVQIPIMSDRHIAAHRFENALNSLEIKIAEL